MSDGSGWLLLICLLPLIFLVYGGDGEPAQPLPVPECRQKDTYHGVSDSNDQSHATMQLLLDRNWTNVRREQHFWTDDIYADCIPTVKA